MVKNKKIKTEFKTVLGNSEIRWTNRYSSNMDNDKTGRWGRVAYAGKFENLGFNRGKISQFEIAWIKKLEDPVTKEFLNRFIIHPQYPFRGQHTFDTLDEAKKEVETTFGYFIKMCVGKIRVRKTK